jgi:hypothetical protein
MSNLTGGTQELHSYLFKVRDSISDNSTNHEAIKAALVELLVYLNSPEGRTSENCTTTDIFFQLHDDYGFNWFHLPEDLRLILEDIGGQLHDTLEHPDIASNFESTPELLLTRIHCLSFRGTH